MIVDELICQDAKEYKENNTYTIDYDYNSGCCIRGMGIEEVEELMYIQAANDKKKHEEEIEKICDQHSNELYEQRREFEKEMKEFLDVVRKANYPVSITEQDIKNKLLLETELLRLQEKYGK